MANKKWIQKANKQMKKKGTVGAFTEYCGGRVTQRCIDKAKASEDPKLVRQAVFAENMRGLGSKKKAQDGMLQTPGIQPAAIEQNLQVPQLQVPGASVADAVTGGGLNVGGMLQDAGMSLAGKGQDLLKGIKGGKIGVSAATDLLAKGATALINKKSGTADDALRNDKTERTGAAVGGAIKGAGKGFDLGNKIIPGLGGVIGGAVGAVGGAFGGKKRAEKERVASVANLRKEQAGQYGDILKANAAFTARAGGMKLPGGQVVPLPDGGKHYIGKKHESGGIDLKRDNIEVEGGETERPIVARDGKTIDYIFSEHHKVNKKMQAKYGVGANTSYADIHRKMEEGGIVADYQELAKDQEDDMKKKGKNQYGPRGSKYIKRGGGLKESIAKLKAQDGKSPADPMAAMRAMQAQLQAQGIGPNIDTSAIPKKNDKLTSMSEADMKRNERLVDKRREKKVMDNIKDTAVLMAKNPELQLDALQLGIQGVAASEIPVISQGAGVLNTLGYAGRSGVKYLKGDKLGAGVYGTLAGGSALGVLPGVGAAADAGNLAILGDKVTKGLSAAGKAAKAAKATKGGNLVYSAKKPLSKGKKLSNVFFEGVDEGAMKVAKKAAARYGGTKMKAQSTETNALTFNDPITGLSTSGLTVGSPNIGSGISTKVLSTNRGGNVTEQPVSETNAVVEANTTPPTTASSTKPKFDVFANAEEGNAFRQWLNTNMPEDAQRLDLDPEGSHNNAYIRRAWGEFGDEFEVDQSDQAYDEEQSTAGQSAIDAIAAGDIPEGATQDKETEEEVQAEKDAIEAAAKASTPGDSESTVEETTALKQSLRDLKKANRAVPPEALAAMAAQAVAPIYALTNKPPRVGGYAPQSYQAPKLGRVSGEADKDRVDQNMSALLASMEGQAMGPAAAANYTNLLSQAQQQKGQIDQRTRQANMQLGAREAQMQTQASQFNIAQNQRAQEYMRNLALMQNQEEFANKFGALQAMGQGIAGSLGDVMKYKSDQKVAKTNVANTLDKEGKDALERANIAAIEKRREMQEELSDATAKARQAKQDQKESDKAAKKNKKALDKAKKAGYDTVEEFEAAQAEAAAQKTAAKQALKDARKSRHGGYTRRRGGIRRIKR